MSDEKQEDLTTLCLSLKKGERVTIGDNIEVICKGRKPGTTAVFQVCFRAPRSTPIRRHKAEREEQEQGQD